MENRIDRLVKQLSEIQLRQTAAIEELKAIGGISTVSLRTKTPDNSVNQDTATKSEIGAPTSNSEHNTSPNSKHNGNTTDSGHDTIGHCYDRYNTRISVNDRVYLLTKGRFKSRIGKVVRIDCDTKWVSIELDNSKQITTRKSENVRIEPRR